MSARQPPPFLRVAPLDRGLSSGLAALRSYVPSEALLSSVEHLLEAQILNDGLEPQEATPSGVRPRATLEAGEPPVARAVASWDADQAHPSQVSPTPLRWGAVALSGMLGAFAASVAIGIVAYRAGEIRSEARAPVATAAALAGPREVPLRPGSVALGSQAQVPAAAGVASDDEASEQAARFSEDKLGLASSRGLAAPRARAGASERAKPELVTLDAAPGPASAPREQGVLNINSIPLSKVVLDGRPLGGTPRVQVPVVAGYHTVVFIHSVRGRIEKQVHVEAGRTVLAAVRFE